MTTEVFSSPFSVNNFREVSRLMTEGRAVMMACEAIEGRENPLKVQRIVRTLWEDQGAETTEDLLTWYAMARILGESPEPPVDDIDEETSDPERDLFVATAWAWMIWATGGPSKLALDELERFDLQEQGISVLHQLALANWAYAVRSLLQDDPQEAKRRFRRAVEVGGQFGTPTNPAITWAYAATFFRVSRETVV